MLSGKIKAEKTTKVHFPTAEEKSRRAFYPFLTSFAKRLRLPKNRFEYTYAVFIISYFFHENIMKLRKVFTVKKES
jgi:hypothetical protein